MHPDTPLAVPDGRSFLRAAALTLALTVALLSGLIFSTQRSSHAAPAVAWAVGTVAPVVVGTVADTVAGLFMNEAVGDIDYFAGGPGGTSGGSTGGSGGSGGFESPAKKTGGRLGAFSELAATVFGMGAYELGWSLADGQDPTYADAPPTGGAPGYTNGYWYASFMGGNQPVGNCLAIGGTDGTSCAYDSTSLGGAMSMSSTRTKTTNLNIEFRCQNVTTLVHVLTVVGGLTSWSHTCGAGERPSRIRYTDGSNIYFTSGSSMAQQPTPAQPATAPGATPLTTTTTTTCSGGGSSATVIKYQPASDTLPKITGGCPAGQTVTGIAQTTVRDSDGATVKSPVGTVTAPAVPSGYPQCQPLGACVLTLLRMAPDGSLLANCQSTGACTGWQTATSTKTGTRTRTITKTDGSTATEPANVYPDQSWLDCRYGPYVVATAECAVVPTDAVPDQPTGTGESASNCNASDFSLNPVSWVVVPLRCLFIPRDSAVQAASSSVSNAWAGTAPAVIWTSVETASAPILALQDKAPGDCAGPTITVPAVGGISRPVSFQPFSTCHPFLQEMLGWYLPVASGMVYLGCFFAGSRIIMRTIGHDGAPVT